jgi:hypothetical protein
MTSFPGTIFAQLLRRTENNPPSRSIPTRLGSVVFVIEQ